MPLLLAIDQSTSATKAILFDTRGKVLDKASRKHRQIYPQPGWVEHNAEEIWYNVLAVIREIVKRNRTRTAKIVALSITNQRETVLVFDKKTGKPLHNALVWQDRRGDSICQKLVKRGHSRAVLQKTGLKIDAYFSASKIQWLIKNKPAIAAKLRNGDAIIGTIDAYLVHRLTGGKVFATDFTNASRTLLFDIGKLRWDTGLCKLFGVPMQSLPEVRESSAHFGDTDAAGILPVTVPIVGVMGDSQAALFAQRCFTPGSAKATFGTGTSVLLNIGSKLQVSHTGAVTALAWVHQGKPTYAFEGIINFSAATIEWLKNQLGLIQTTSDVEKLAATVADNGGVYLIPAFAGLSAPYWNPDARAAIIGLTAHSTRAHVARAAVESIGYQLRDVLDMMKSDAGVPLKRIRADGGATANKFLMQFTADIAGVDVLVSDVAECSALGATLAGALGLGFFKSLDELAASPGRTKIYRPQARTAANKQLYAGWLAAVKRVL